MSNTTTAQKKFLSYFGQPAYKIVIPQTIDRDILKKCDMYTLASKLHDLATNMEINDQ